MTRAAVTPGRPLWTAGGFGDVTDMPCRLLVAPRMSHRMGLSQGLVQGSWQGAGPHGAEDRPKGTEVFLLLQGHLWGAQRSSRLDL